MTSRSKCKVNSDGSVCLKNILSSFNSSLREEHAWALCYQCAKFFSECLQSPRSEFQAATEVEHIYIQPDGNVHQNTVLKHDPDMSRKSLDNEQEIVSSLGLIIYKALDQGTPNDEERVISQDLEQLIGDMMTDDFGTGAEQTFHETDDEGIERDAEESEEASASKVSTSISLQEVIKRCETHLGTLTKMQAEAHYKAVVRALVAEALELATFLEKVAQGSISLPSNSNAKWDQLNFSDWAKFWVQVMGELRMGVKLKKVNYTKAPIEYELTPYEILMKDIRSCKYNLRKIMVNGNVPSRVTKDAHAIILEFIRSRPPLKKASDRKLPPYRRTLTPREQLLNSIKKGRKLRPVPKPRTNCPPVETKTTPKEEVAATSGGRRLIKVDFSQFEDDEDEDEHSDSPEFTEPGLWSSELSQVPDSTLDAYDLATQELGFRSNVRRYTLGVCDQQTLGCYSVPQSRPGSRQSCNSSEAESVHLEPDVAQAIQDELTSTHSWQDSISLDDRLSLTLSEIVHIRAVLTKAELEALPVEGKVRHDVEARKVCFLCLKTRFGIFGPWGQRCSLCKRTVCSKCYSKMNIPMEHFSSVPVVLLSPSIMCTPEDEPKDVFSKSLVNKLNGTDSNNSPQPSPDTSRPSSSMGSTHEDAAGLSKFRTKASSVTRAARVVDRLKTPLMVVCHDCKMMVLQIIKSARANRSAVRNKTLQNLTLNLSPVF